MPRLSFNDAEKYQGNSHYFSLADDGDFADVTVLANTIEDIPIYAVHRLDFGKYSVSVNCLRQPDEPAHVCPLCAAGNNTRIVIELVLLTASGIKVFERGKRFMPKIQRWGRQFPLICHPVLQITRVGKSGDQATTYDFDKVADNGKIRDWRELADEKDVQAILSAIIKDWTADDMTYYIEYGKDPFGNTKSSADGNEVFKPRGSASAQRPQARQVPQRPVRVQSAPADEYQGEDTYDDVEPERPNPSRRASRQAPPVRTAQSRQAPRREVYDDDEESF